MVSTCCQPTHRHLAAAHTATFYSRCSRHCKRCRQSTTAPLVAGKACCPPVGTLELSSSSLSLVWFMAGTNVKASSPRLPLRGALLGRRPGAAPSFKSRSSFCAASLKDRGFSCGWKVRSASVRPCREVTG